MRRVLSALTACTLAILLAGCCTPNDALKRAASGNTRDLRLIRSEVITQLPTTEVEIGDKTWTLRGLWDNRIAAFLVRARAIEAGLADDKSFDTKQAAKEEGVTTTPR